MVNRIWNPNISNILKARSQVDKSEIKDKVLSMLCMKDINIQMGIPDQPVAHKNINIILNITLKIKIMGDNRTKINNKWPIERIGLTIEYKMKELGKSLKLIQSISIQIISKIHKDTQNQ